MPSLRALRMSGCRSRGALPQERARQKKTADSGTAWEGRPEGVRAPYATSDRRLVCVSLSTTEHVEFRGKQGRPLSKAKYSWRPIVNKYREGKVKSTPEGGCQDLKPRAPEQSEPD